MTYIKCEPWRKINSLTDNLILKQDKVVLEEIKNIIY